MQLRLAALLSICAACDNPKLAGVPVDGGAFSRALYTKFAARVVECTGQPSIAVDRGLDIDNIEKRVANSVTKKRLQYNREIGKQCLDGLAATDCDGLLDLFIEGSGPCD